MNEKNMVDMQKHIEALRTDNNILINNIVKKETMLHNKSKQFRYMIGGFIIVLAFLGVWINALYYANNLLAIDNKTKENWKQSAIILDEKYNDCQDDISYVKHGMEEALSKGFIQKMPPQMVKVA